MDDGKFKARHAVDGTTIGRFDTVVEAAVAHARHVAKKGAAGLPAPAPAAEPSKKAPSTRAAARRASAGGRAAGGAEGGRGGGGFRLHLSAHSATGYKCVVPAPKQQGKFQARDQSGGVTSANAHLGTFDTAVEAARACSAHGEEGGEGGPEGSGRGGGGLPPAPQFEVGQLFRLHGVSPMHGRWHAQHRSVATQASAATTRRSRRRRARATWPRRRRRRKKEKGSRARPHRPAPAPAPAARAAAR